ncbi:MAG: hypothetical protein IPI20_18700 [Rhodoferax sp.]|nr:hypothetical protein [Rhodoferax sp.]MBK7549702.1 hypothetical protein [Rhodoferax sp.]
MNTKNILALPTAGRGTVMQARRVGRFPKIVTRLSAAREALRLNEWEEKVIVDAIVMAEFQIDMSRRAVATWRQQLAQLLSTDLTLSDRKKLALEIAANGLPLPQKQTAQPCSFNQ